MITVRIIQYWNDYHKKGLRERFENLAALADWIFSQMQVDYSQKNGRDFLSFPRCRTVTEIYEISVRPNYGGHVFWIKQIEDDYRGILFSDGTFTAGQKHCTKDVREWLADCEKRKQNPAFRFAPDIAKHPSPFTKKFIPEPVFLKAAKKIHEAGGCDAGDDYSQGYDAAITTALKILLEETGYRVEDIVDYEDTEEDENAV